MSKTMVTCPLCGAKAKYVTLYEKDGETRCFHMADQKTVERPAPMRMLPVFELEDIGRLSAEGRLDEVLEQCRSLRTMRLSV